MMTTGSSCLNRVVHLWIKCSPVISFCLWSVYLSFNTFKESVIPIAGGFSLFYYKVIFNIIVCEINVFFLVQATIQKLLEEGVQLNSPAVPPQDKQFCVSEEDPQWVIYRWKHNIHLYQDTRYFDFVCLCCLLYLVFYNLNMKVIWNNIFYFFKTKVRVPKKQSLHLGCTQWLCCPKGVHSIL